MDADRLSIFQFFQIFPTEEDAVRFVEAQRWPYGVACPHCESGDILTYKNGKPMPYRCRECKRHFSVRTGSLAEKSPLPIRKWLFAIYLHTSARKGISSIQLAKQLGITQKSAWFMSHRIRDAFAAGRGLLFATVEADETYLGGKERNKHFDKKLRAGRGGVGKQPVLGLKQRGGDVVAFPVQRTDAEQLTASIREHVEPGANVYTDGYSAYADLVEYTHETVAHSSGEYVRGDVHTNGIESVWAVLKRSYYGTHHWFSPKHMHRYLNEVCGRLNLGHDPWTLMNAVVVGMFGKRLTYAELTGRRP